MTIATKKSMKYIMCWLGVLTWNNWDDITIQQRQQQQN